MIKTLLVAATLACALPLGAEQDRTDLVRAEEDFVRAVERARASVVSVASEYAMFRGKEEKDEDTFEVAYSGVVVDGKGHIVTVASAARDARSITVTTPDECEHDATVVGIDDRTNLAVLRIDAEGLVPVEFADPKSVRYGTWVIEVGNAFGMPGSVSDGIVSGLDRNLGRGDGVLMNMLQTTAPVNPGDSGGLLANTRGQLVGVVASTFQRAPSMESFEEAMKDVLGGGSLDSFLRELQDLSTGGSNDPKRVREMMNRWMRKLAERSRDAGRGRGGFVPGHLLGAEAVNFATPAETVRFVVDSIVAKGKVERGWLGVEVKPAPAALRRKLGLPAGATALLVGRLVEDGPAQEGGLGVDDVILKIDGKPLSRLSDLERFVSQTSGGTTVTLEVASGGERKEIVVKLGTRPEEPK